MDCKRSCSFNNLTNDLVVEILSWLPFKSFCRFKCVCKAWLNFSSDPYYFQKLPKISSGFFYQDDRNSVIQSISLSSKDEGIDLSFLPQHAHLNFVDCSSGLVLCEYRSNSTSPDIFRFIVCNPATREWRVLPDVQRDTERFDYRTVLAFDPSRSSHFCVFHFPHELSPDGNDIRGISKVEMFSSLYWTWFEDDYLWDPENDPIEVSEWPHAFVGRTLYVRTYKDDFLAVEELDGYSIPPFRWTFKSPLQVQLFESIVDSYGCLGHASPILYYAAPEKHGCTVVVWSASGPDKWTVKHRLSMKDAFGRDDFVHYDDVAMVYYCDYRVVVIDLEREVLFLFDYKARKLLSYSIGTGKLTIIKDEHHWYKYYVPCYSKLAALDRDY